MRLEQVKFREQFEPKTVYLRRNDSGHCQRVRDCRGKTLRSWVSYAFWQVYLYQFSEYTEITEHDYNEWTWARKHQYRIGELVSCCKDPAIVRAVAQLVNFTEVP